MLPIRTILHPTDFSAESHSAFEVASSLARDYKAKLLLLHVVPPPRVYAPDGIAVPFPVEEPLNARANLDQLKPADATITVERDVREGDAATEILKFAEEKQVDLIVMGTHGTSGLTRLLVGSVAESVLRKAPCPVLTVRGRFRVSPEGSATHGASSERT